MVCLRCSRVQLGEGTSTAIYTARRGLGSSLHHGQLLGRFDAFLDMQAVLGINARLASGTRHAYTSDQLQQRASLSMRQLFVLQGGVEAAPTGGG